VVYNTYELDNLVILSFEASLYIFCDGKWFLRSKE